MSTTERKREPEGEASVLSVGSMNLEATACFLTGRKVRAPRPMVVAAVIPLRRQTVAFHFLRQGRAARSPCPVSVLVDVAVAGRGRAVEARTEPEETRKTHVAMTHDSCFFP